MADFKDLVTTVLKTPWGLFGISGVVLTLLGICRGADLKIAGSINSIGLALRMILCPAPTR
jgi:hypothetical protein